MNIPTGWNDITIEQYQNLCNNINDTSLNELELIVSNISVLCNIEYSDILKLPLKETTRISNELEFIGQVPDSKFINKFIIDKTIYSVLPDVSKMTYGQFKALSHYTKENTNYNLHFIMALFCYEEGTTYDKDFESRAELFRKRLDMGVVFPLSGFFLELLKRFVTVIQHYSLERAERIVSEIGQEIQSLQQTNSSTKHSVGSM